MSSSDWYSLESKLWPIEIFQSILTRYASIFRSLSVNAVTPPILCVGEQHLPLSHTVHSLSSLTEKLLRRKHRDSQFTGLGQLASGLLTTDQVVGLAGHGIADMGAQ